MTQFEFITVAQSLVLGLGVALLLTSALTAFRHRHATRLDWISLTWAGCIFVSQMQFWWAMGFLVDDLTIMSGPAFTLTIVQTIMLFVAGGLILPQDSRDLGNDLGAHFDRDGRFGVIAYGVYWVAGLAGNIMLHGRDLFEPLHSTVFALILLCFLTGARPRVRSLATTLAVIVLVANTLWPRPGVF